MNLHEKSLELNITHELLNLADSFNWHLTNIALWQYWEPSHMHFKQNDYKKAVAYGLYSNIEGRDDSTGEAGGGYDVKIKSGQNESVLFIQYKKGDYLEIPPKDNDNGNKSIFNVAEPKYFKFELNSTQTNQHFTLRKLSENITKQKGNAVVYAFPLIKDIADLDNNAGKIIRRTKFISIKDIDDEALKQNHPFEKKPHSYRICAEDMERTELNYYYYYYKGVDRSKSIISDTIILGIQKSIQNFKDSLNTSIEEVDKNNISEILELTINAYRKYILNYFEVPIDYDFGSYSIRNYQIDYPDSLTKKRDIAIVQEVMEYLKSVSIWLKDIESNPLPEYSPKYFTLNIELDINFKSEYLRNVSMIKI